MTACAAVRCSGPQREARKGPGPLGLLGTVSRHAAAVEIVNAYAEDPR